MNNCLNFNFCKYKEDVDNGIQELKPLTSEKVEDNDISSSLLRTIYSVGEDGYPVGDLATFVGKNASPEVKKFILDNLMRDVSGMANPSSTGLSDDDITLLTRQSGESMHSYAQRLNESIDKDKYILSYAKRVVSQNSAPKPSSE